MSKQRLIWLDGMRGLAILWIVFVHFVVIFTPNEAAIFPGLLGLILFGISGKLAVAGCCVIMGYFASQPRTSDQKIWKYAIQRYLTFALQILLIEGCYLLISRFPSLNGYSLRCVEKLSLPLSQLLPYYLSDAFLFRAHLLPTYWCIDSFVIGSILVFAFARLTQKLPLWIRSLLCLISIAVFILLESVWLAIVFMGWAFRLLTEWNLPFRKHPLFCILLLAFVPWMIRRGECPNTYLLDGAASLIVLYVFSQWNWIQKLLSFRPLSKLGSQTLEIFMLHIPIFEVLRYLLDHVCDLPLTIPHYTLMFLGVLSITVLIVLGWRKYINRFIFQMLKV